MYHNRGADGNTIPLKRLNSAEISKLLSSSNIISSSQNFRRELWRHQNMYRRSGHRYSDLSDPLNYDNSQSYDKWSQAYRMIGAYIDCDQTSGGNNNNKNGNGSACSRWIIWAAYHDPNYKGGEYNEYSSHQSDLDCHEKKTKWQLIGVYREQLYQWYEQMSKHLWAYDDYEYIVATAGLAYMTESDCTQVGSYKGSAVYAGVEPVSNGNIAMGLYTDYRCTNLLHKSNRNAWKNRISYENFVQQSSYGGNSNSGSESTWWKQSQEPTMTLFNQVFEDYKSCTLCLDYPTYQDGSVVGNSGTDDGSLINQCWKFFSHNSYTCNGDCLTMASTQGTILQIKYRGKIFGSGVPNNSQTEKSFFSIVSSNHSMESKLRHLLQAGIVIGSILILARIFSSRKRNRNRERLLNDYITDER